MYLSRLVLDRRSRYVRMDLARPYEMHRTLMHAFPDDLTEGVERVLYRLETHPQTGVPTLLVQSKLAPQWTQLPPGYLLAGQEQPNPQVKEIHLSFQPGQLLAFRLLANPTKRLSKSLPQGREESKRVGLYKPDEQLAWLLRKGEAHGFQVVSAVPNQQAAMKDRQRLLEFLGVQFDGLLTVIDPARLSDAVSNGIGSAKAFGCGLLSLAPAR
jgi:CRISPR system Cascade subunit CasE